MNAQPERMRLRLGRYDFDPSTDAPEMPDELRSKLAPDQAGPWVVQFNGPLTLDDQKRLRAAYRLALTEYIPDSAYLEVLAPDVRAKLADDELVRAMVPYEPAYKVAPLVGERVFRSEERQDVDGLWLNVVLFDHADPMAVAKAIGRLSGVGEVQVIDDRPIGGSLLLRLLRRTGPSSPASPPCPRSASSTRCRSPAWTTRVPPARSSRGRPAPRASGTRASTARARSSASWMATRSTWRTASSRTPRWRHRAPRTARCWRSATPRAWGSEPITRSWRASRPAMTPTTWARRRAAAARTTPPRGWHHGGPRVGQHACGADGGLGAVPRSIRTAARRRPRRGQPRAIQPDRGRRRHLHLEQRGSPRPGFGRQHGRGAGRTGTAKNAICCGAAQADPNEMNLATATLARPSTTGASPTS